MEKTTVGMLWKMGKKRAHWCAVDLPKGSHPSVILDAGETIHSAAKNIQFVSWMWPSEWLFNMKLTEPQSISLRRATLLPAVTDQGLSVATSK